MNKTYRLSKQELSIVRRVKLITKYPIPDIFARALNMLCDELQNNPGAGQQVLTVDVPQTPRPGYIDIAFSDQLEDKMEDLLNRYKTTPFQIYYTAFTYFFEKAAVQVVKAG